jgi:ribonuclease P protein component
MLPAPHRLRSRAEFARVSSDGRRANGRYVVVSVAVDPVAVDSAGPRPPRVGFAVSRRVGNSVVRHRVTRRLRHAARPLLAGLPGGALVLVRALPAAATADFTSMENDLAKTLNSACQRALRRGGRTVRPTAAVATTS